MAGSSLPEVKEEYFPKLKHNNIMINEHKFENELYTFFNHHLYRENQWLQEWSDEDIMEKVKENLLRLRSLYEE